jgi:hypothetical protein
MMRRIIVSFREWRLWSLDTDSVGLSLLTGGSVRCRPLRRISRVLVVATDVDPRAGVAAIWLVRHPRSRRAVEYECLYQTRGDSWEPAGAAAFHRGEPFAFARPSARILGPASLLRGRGGSASRSMSTGREASGLPYQQAGAPDWVVCSTFQVAIEVDRLFANGREVSVPWHGHVIIAWKSSASWRPSGRPHISAISSNGKLLTELGAEEYVDSATLAS